MRARSDCASDAQSGQALTARKLLQDLFSRSMVQIFFLVFHFSPDPNESCRTELSAASSGYLTPPDSNDDGQYDYNLDCWWVFIGGEFQSVYLLLQNIDIEEKENCQSDKLEVSGLF